MNRSVILIRVTETDLCVYGILLVLDGALIKFACMTVENKSKLFPPGVYPLKFELSDSFQMELWELYDVVGITGDPDKVRGEIKIHIANKYSQLRGCIGVGLNHQDIDDDGVIDVAHSGDALKQFHKSMSGIKESEIKVIKAY